MIFFKRKTQYLDWNDYQNRINIMSDFFFKQKARRTFLP